MSGAACVLTAAMIVSLWSVGHRFLKTATTGFALAAVLCAFYIADHCDARVMQMAHPGCLSGFGENAATIMSRHYTSFVTGFPAVSATDVQDPQ